MLKLFSLPIRYDYEHLDFGNSSDPASDLSSYLNFKTAVLFLTFLVLLGVTISLSLCTSFCSIAQQSFIRFNRFIHSESFKGSFQPNNYMLDNKHTKLCSYARTFSATIGNYALKQKNVFLLRFILKCCKWKRTQLRHILQKQHEYMPSSLFSNDIKSENFERLLLAYRQQKISFIVGPHNGKIDTSTLNFQSVIPETSMREVKTSQFIYRLQLMFNQNFRDINYKTNTIIINYFARFFFHSPA